MPRIKTFLTPSEYAILGLVRQKPTYGYQIQRSLSGRNGLARVCPVEPAMVYASLKTLSGLELVEGRWDNSRYPPRAIYAATEAGDAEFQRWLARPVDRMREIRLDFLIKLYFTLQEQPRLAIDLVQQQIATCDAYESEIRTEISDVPDDDKRAFALIVLESKLTAAKLTRQWLMETLEKLEQSQGVPA